MAECSSAPKTKLMSDEVQAPEDERKGSERQNIPLTQKSRPRSKPRSRSCNQEDPTKDHSRLQHEYLLSQLLKKEAENKTLRAALGTRDAELGRLRIELQVLTKVGVAKPISSTNLEENREAWNQAQRK